MTDLAPNNETRPGVITLDLRNTPLSMAIQELEKEYFSHVMTEARGNKAQAARLSGLADDTFRKKIRRYNFQTIFRCA